MKLRRSSGILCHVSSLPGPFGIGDMGPGADHFLDWLVAAGQSLWQVLPLGPTGYGDSPYAPFSSFAGNELLLSPELLLEEGLLDAADLDSARVPVTARVDYSRTIPLKRRLVDKASRQFDSRASTSERADYNRFCKENAYWLDDYVLFMDIKEEYDAKAAAQGAVSSAWNLWWPKELAARDPQALKSWHARRADELRIRTIRQYLFYRQWKALRARANKLGIEIIGDLPIFVAMDSADAWAQSSLFALDKNLMPLEVAGVPPDYFSEDGQLWGNPLYAWEQHKKDGFSWWIARVSAALTLYDYVRIDHFRGLEAYWAIPGGSPTARTGQWKPSPGRELLAAIRDRLGGSLPIIAEDLGVITPPVQALRDDFGLPGMRVLQFAFGPGADGTGLDASNSFLPHNYSVQSVVYTGTHDNDTTQGWLAGLSEADLALVDAYLGPRAEDRLQALMREASRSVAAVCIVPLQDALGLGTDTRMNTPSTLGGNWEWRMADGQTTAQVARWLKELSQTYGRMPQ